MYLIIAQALGILGSVLLVLSFQMKKTKHLFALQCLANLSFCFNYLMLDSVTGAVSMIIGIFPPLIVMLTEGKNKIWLYVMQVVYVLVGIFTYDGWLSVLVVLVQMVCAFAQWTNNGKTIRTTRLAVSPVWLAYNIRARSIGAIVAEAFTMVSIVVYFFRTRNKTEQKAKCENQ